MYAVQLYSLGLPVTIVVDDFVPFAESGEPLYEKPTAGKALWVMILEKAFAKYNGLYGVLQDSPGYGIWSGSLA